MFPGTFHLFRLLTFMSMRSPEASSGEQCCRSYNVSKCAALSYRLKSRVSPELRQILSECKLFCVGEPIVLPPSTKNYSFYYCEATLAQFSFTPRPDPLALRLRSVCPCLGLGCPSSCRAKRIKGSRAVFGLHRNKDFPGGHTSNEGI